MPLPNPDNAVGFSFVMTSTPQFDNLFMAIALEFPIRVLRSIFSWLKEEASNANCIAAISNNFCIQYLLKNTGKSLSLEPTGNTHPGLICDQHFMLQFAAVKKYDLSVGWRNILLVITVKNA